MTIADMNDGNDFNVERVIPQAPLFHHACPQNSSAVTTTAGRLQLMTLIVPISMQEACLTRWKGMVAFCSTMWGGRGFGESPIVAS